MHSLSFNAVFGETSAKEFVKEIFKCRTCNGTGSIKNTCFEVCRDQDHDFHGKPCNSKCPDWQCCSRGERLVCRVCNGTGYERLSWEEFYERLTKEA